MRSGSAGVRWDAVRGWQNTHYQVNGLFADGIIGEKTIEAARMLAGGGHDLGPQTGANGGPEAAKAAKHLTSPETRHHGPGAHGGLAEGVQQGHERAKASS